MYKFQKIKSEARKLALYEGNSETKIIKIKN